MKLLIAEKLKEKKMTQKKLAELIGISAPYLTNIISQKRSCDMDLLEKIADALDVSVISLIDDERSSVISSFRTDEGSFEIRKVSM